MQNNVDAADSAESEELLTDAPPWCYSESGVIAACSPVADRVVRAGVHELQVQNTLYLFTTCTHALPVAKARINVCAQNVTGVAATRPLLLPVQAIQGLGVGGRLGWGSRVQSQHHAPQLLLLRRGL